MSRIGKFETLTNHIKIIDWLAFMLKGCTTAERAVSIPIAQLMKEMGMTHYFIDALVAENYIADAGRGFRNIRNVYLTLNSEGKVKLDILNESQTIEREKIVKRLLLLATTIRQEKKDQKVIRQAKAEVTAKSVTYVPRMKKTSKLKPMLYECSVCHVSRLPKDFKQIKQKRNSVCIFCERSAEAREALKEVEQSTIPVSKKQEPIIFQATEEPNSTSRITINLSKTAEVKILKREESTVITIGESTIVVSSNIIISLV